jgi:chromosome segregation ATPase
MKDEQIEKIRRSVETADHISREKKAELLRLISNLRPAIARASRTHDEHATKVARLVEASAHGATQKEPIEKLLSELKEAVEKFEGAHPELVAAVAEYSAFLSAIGI